MGHFRFTIFLAFALITSTTTQAQQTITSTLMHNGVERNYIVYIPASYDASENVPLVLNFHGYTSNASEQMFYGDFRPIADREGFIVVHPNGTVDLVGNQHWNVGWGTSTVDDVNFISTLIDQLLVDYAINEERIYSTGMSNGGFISYEIACQLSDRIAAIASVTGSMSITTYDNCNPSRPIPVMQIHGTADNVVAYDGGLISRSIDDVMDYWVDHNDCNETPSVTAIEDINTMDGSTVEHYVYANGELGVTTELFLIENGGHTWPGTLFNSPGTNQDINASEEAWAFFSRYDINGAIQTSSDNNLDISYDINITPNPAADFTEICWDDSNASSMQAFIYDINGKILLTKTQLNNCDRIDISELTSGMYFLHIIESNTGRSSTRRIMKI